MNKKTQSKCDAILDIMARTEEIESDDTHIHMEVEFGSEEEVGFRVVVDKKFYETRPNWHVNHVEQGFKEQAKAVAEYIKRGRK